MSKKIICITAIFIVASPYNLNLFTMYVTEEGAQHYDTDGYHSHLKQYNPPMGKIANILMVLMIALIALGPISLVLFLISK